MYSDKNLINRRNVKSDVTSAVNAFRRFFEIEIEARVVAAGLCVLEMDDVDGDPKHNTYDGPKDVRNEKKAYLRKIASKVVDRFVSFPVIQCIISEYNQSVTHNY